MSLRRRANTSCARSASGRRAGHPSDRSARSGGRCAPGRRPDRRPHRTRSTRARRRGERVLVTTLTKKMAEDLTDYLETAGIKVRYMHHDVKTIERHGARARPAPRACIDVLVGINLLREGLDIPEVSLVAILDADKEGFLRIGDFAHPDHRPRRAKRARHGRAVCRQHHAPR